MKMKLVIVMMLLLTSISHAKSFEPSVVKALLFYSAADFESQILVKKTLPDLIFNKPIQIIMINTNTVTGSQAYTEALFQYAVPLNSMQLPMLIDGKQYITGKQKIIKFLEKPFTKKTQSLQQDWPQIKAIDQIIDFAKTPIDSPLHCCHFMKAEEAKSWWNFYWENAMINFKQDLIANYLALFILSMLLAVAIKGLYYVKKIFTKQPVNFSSFPANNSPWIFLILSCAGLLVASYLAYIEVTGREAVCGPIGHCNQVQQSPYATLFGIIPVALAGMIYFLSQIMLWVLKQGPVWLTSEVYEILMSANAMMAIFFFIYLTFLEPFVIGATCSWCLTAAVITIFQFWCILPTGLQSLEKFLKEPFQPFNPRNREL